VRPLKFRYTHLAFRRAAPECFNYVGSEFAKGLTIWL
jgi:hypothetical protein